MAIKQHRPTSAGRRISSSDAFADVTKTTPEKRLTTHLKKHAGRNNSGKITVRHHGGGVKRRYRIVDFMQTRFDMPAKVVAIEYDPNRSARIALVEYSDNTRAYILAPDGLTVGRTVLSTQGKGEVEVGNRMPLKHVPTGVMVYNIELFPGRKGSVVRSAGNSAIVMAQDEGFVQLKLPSTEVRRFDERCLASIGTVSNADWMNIRWGKAGRMRYRGVRPTVRGKVMNPVDHPHGGGEGAQSIGLTHPKTPQGKPALGVKTRRQKKQSSRYIVSSRKKRND
ncbi:MAG: 50S ribosomal protein L2 [Candidatus Kerfeldbacteria bacterium]|nr:50S ribosomal protein L2 [Candidatus Kerfeldbacteria bacterium]